MNQLLTVQNTLSKDLKISCKKIAYAFDLKVKRSIEPLHLKYEAVGKVRVGPIRSKVKLESKYNRSDAKLDLVHVDYQVQGLRINETQNYTKVEHGEALGEDSLVDPLHLLFCLNNFFDADVKCTSFKMCFNKKIRSYRLIKSSDKLTLMQDDSKLCDLYIEGKIILIKPHQLNVKILLEPIEIQN